MTWAEPAVGTESFCQWGNEAPHTDAVMLDARILGAQSTKELFAVMQYRHS